MTAASPAGGVSRSGGSSNRSSSGAQRGLLMAPSGLAAVGGRWGRGARRAHESAEQRAGGLAGSSREPPGRYKGERSGDSRPRPPGSRRRGHGTGTPPRSHARPPGSAGFQGDTCQRAAPRTPPWAPRRQSPQRGAPIPAILSAPDSPPLPSHALESLSWAETHSLAVLVSKAPRAQCRQLAAHLFYRCLGSAYYVPDAV